MGLDQRSHGRHNGPVSSKTKEPARMYPVAKFYASLPTVAANDKEFQAYTPLGVLPAALPPAVVRELEAKPSGVALNVLG